MAKQYIMKGLDDALWQQVKIKAVQQEQSVKDVIVHLLREWLKEK